MSETLAVLDGSESARKRLLSIRGEPLFYADWDNVIFIHYQTDPQELQRCIPYHLDLYDGRAFVSLVAFTMRGMRPRLGGSLSALFFKPISTHHFLNVRTTSYIRRSWEFISCRNGFRVGWRRGWVPAASGCLIDSRKWITTAITSISSGEK